ncbi:MAG: Hsp20/alpha crystallin family protein [Candidatus Njordarchaeales archaeon]
MGDDDKKKRKDPFFDLFMNLMQFINNAMQSLVNDLSGQDLYHEAIIEEEEHIPQTVIEDREFVWVYIDLPGVSKETLRISVEKGFILVTGKRYGKLLKKAFKVPKNAQPELLSTRYNNGVLEIKFRKKLVESSIP